MPIQTSQMQPRLRPAKGCQQIISGVRSAGLFSILVIAPSPKLTMPGYPQMRGPPLACPRVPMRHDNFQVLGLPQTVGEVGSRGAGDEANVRVTSAL
jgi:hypothetical protein